MLSYNIPKTMYIITFFQKNMVPNHSHLCQNWVQSCVSVQQNTTVQGNQAFYLEKCMKKKVSVFRLNFSIFIMLIIYQFYYQQYLNYLILFGRDNARCPSYHIFLLDIESTFPIISGSQEVILYWNNTEAMQVRQATSKPGYLDT